MIRSDETLLAEGRLTSLDAYRGFVMLAMVSGGMGLGHLVDDPTWGWLANQFRHREWEGCTFWDLIQPSFMFIVGVAMPLAFARRQKRDEPWSRQIARVLKRCGLLIAIGVFLDCYRYETIHIELVRVLQQIAIGYTLAFFVLHRGPRIQAAAALLVLALHTGAYVAYGALNETPPWVKGQNVGAALDQVLHVPFEPDWTETPLNGGGYVTLNALSSTATILFGVLCGELLRGGWSARRKWAVLIAAGLGGLFLGSALAQWAGVPLVKRIWTASFAVYAAGWTCLLMAAFFGTIEVIGWRRWTFPLVAVGVNSIAMYTFSETLTGPITRAVRAPLGIALDQLPAAGPVILAVLVVLAKWYFCYWLYRHRIYFKV